MSVEHAWLTQCELSAPEVSVVPEMKCLSGRESMREPTQATVEPLWTRAALPIAALGVAAAAVCGALAIARGFVWIVPMTLCLTVGLSPLGVRMCAGRTALLRALERAPARRYQLPHGNVAGSTPVAATLEGWKATRVSVRPLRSLGPVGEWAALVPGSPSVPLRSMLRLRYVGWPFDSCVPAVLVPRSGGCVAVAWAGPAAVIVAELPRGAWDWTTRHGEAAWDAALSAAQRADAARAADLQAIGAVDLVAGPAAENALRDAGYQRIGLIPLAALADALTLAELEFAWPADASFQIKRFSGAVAPSGHGLEGLHAEGGRSTGAGQERLDLIIVRIADDRTLAYARRQQEREPTADVS